MFYVSIIGRMITVLIGHGAEIGALLAFTSTNSCITVRGIRCLAGSFVADITLYKRHQILQFSSVDFSELSPESPERAQRSFTMRR